MNWFILTKIIFLRKIRSVIVQKYFGIICLWFTVQLYHNLGTINNSKWKKNASIMKETNSS